MDRIEPNADEQRAIRALERVAKTWPKSLWLFSASGTLHVMKKGVNGERMILPSQGVDGEYAITSINIENDGGDW